MADKFKIEPGSVQETLIIPLYGRKLCAQIFPNLYTDLSAERLCAQLDYDFCQDAHRAHGL